MYGFLVNLNDVLLRQAFSNLLSNAIKFSYENQEIAISVKAENSDVRIDVSDQGVGFTSDQKERLFEKFSTLHGSGTLAEKSTGLGLYLTKMIVENHRGRIEGYSDGEGKEATISVFFQKYNHISQAIRR